MAKHSMSEYQKQNAISSHEVLMGHVTNVPHITAQAIRAAALEYDAVIARLEEAEQKLAGTAFDHEVMSTNGAYSLDLVAVTGMLGSIEQMLDGVQAVVRKLKTSVAAVVGRSA